MNVIINIFVTLVEPLLNYTIKRYLNYSNIFDDIDLVGYLISVTEMLLSVCLKFL